MCSRAYASAIHVETRICERAPKAASRKSPDDRCAACWRNAELGHSTMTASIGSRIFCAVNTMFISGTYCVGVSMWRASTSARGRNAGSLTTLLLRKQSASESAEESCHHVCECTSLDALRTFARSICTNSKIRDSRTERTCPGANR
eukprot:Amastigsp_a511552_21.p4 type:complete len:147 gc:universal Amastigsp_a511552_21:336-776(+)